MKSQTVNGISGNHRLTALLLLGVANLAFMAAAQKAPAPFNFKDVTAETGIDFVHTDGNCDKYYIMENVTAGLATFDYDSDGDVDIYFLNGAPLKGATAPTPPRNRLYRNDGNWKFTDVTNASGLGDTGYGLGVCVGDYDSDGDQDVYLNNYGPNKLYRNNGDGTFTDVTQAAGVGNGDQVGAGACFLDMDGDGDLDLYVSNYLDFSYDIPVYYSQSGVRVYANPRHYKPLPDTLYRNNGDGTFTDVSRESGIAAHAGWGMGITAADYDNDGDTDIFIGNDVAENFLFKNDGTGKFEEVALITGFAYDVHGDEMASMGVDSGDYDNDGWLDFYVTSYQRELTALYKNSGQDFFEDVTLQTGAGAGTLPHVTWGNTLADFDNDGDRDIFVACGHLQIHIAEIDDTSEYRAKNLILSNDGAGKFTDVSAQSGDAMAVQQSSRGAAFDDLDNDGDVDIVVLNSRAAPTVIRNDTKSDGHWLQVKLRGSNGNTFGVGAHVIVKAGDLTLMDEVHSGRGYQSHYGDRLYFGLGKRDTVDSITVKWLGGGVQTVKDVTINSLRIIEQTVGK